MKFLFVLLFFIIANSAYAVKVDSALNDATKSLSEGGLSSISNAEKLATSVTLAEPKSKLAYWLKAQSLYIQAGVGFELDKIDKKFLDEAKARSLLIPEDKLPGNVLGLQSSHKDEQFFLVMETKSSRLFVFSNLAGVPKLVESFYSSIGLFGDRKKKEGDKKTPIGVYRILKELKNPRADGFLGNTALTLDYPNAEDKYSGRTGHGIWIHGVPSNVHVRSPRSSDGCLALANADVGELKKFINLGESHILIVSEIWWLSKKDWVEQDKRLRNLFSVKYETSKNNKTVNANEQKVLVAYLRVDRNRPSVAIIKNRKNFYREYWIENNEGFKRHLNER